MPISQLETYAKSITPFRFGDFWTATFDQNRCLLGNLDVFEINLRCLCIFRAREQALCPSTRM